MKVLFVWPVCTFSVWDVARGYRTAIARIVGEENIRDYQLNVRTEHHRRALHPEPPSRDATVLARLASETVINEALYFDADVVFVVSGLNFHPIGLWALKKVGIHAAAIMTESPYDDVNQQDWSSVYPGMTVFTNEIRSAEQYGWHYLPHAYDPGVHYPRDPQNECDVLMCCTGWEERQHMLESIDWTGIDLRLYGIWPAMTKASPLWDYTWPVCVDNLNLPSLYAGAKICINIHRAHAGARSLNPRAYEIAACGAFQLSDHRDELDHVFGDTVPTFDGPQQLIRQIKHYLANNDERLALAASASHRVRDHDFEHRAIGVVEILQQAVNERKLGV